jgi:hypothetical protein
VKPAVTEIIGALPFRMALAGGWIDQPFVSKFDPAPPGSMVVASLEPTCWFMERSGIATGTRSVAIKLWKGRLPDRDPNELVRELYRAENEGRSEPSGSQDMIGLVYPGVSRLDYDYGCNGGVFPRHIESNNDPEVARWLENVIHLLPIAPRPEGYSPLDVKNLDPAWIRRLGSTGRECFDAVIARDAAALGSSMNCCMEYWEAILPNTVRHPALTVDLKSILTYYQSRYCGAMYSGCGGGYLIVVSTEPVPGALKVRIRVAQP